MPQKDSDISRQPAKSPVRKMPDPAPRKSSMNRPGYLEVSDEYAGQRVDNFLIRELKGVPKTRLYRALRKGEVRVNKGRVKADYRLQVGDRVRIPPIRMAAGKPIRPPPAHWLGLDKERTLYEDRGLLVINKPAGLAVHGGSGLTIGLIESLRLMRSGDNYLELVHRLDRETSGCLMVARRAAVLKELHRQLREDRIDKRYLALVEGIWPRQLRDVEAPLLKNTLRSGQRVVRVDKAGKFAHTEFQVVQRFAGCTLLQARPHTGRTHQIRVHARHAGHPLLGDAKYSSRDQLKAARGRGLQRLFLHAQTLSFDDAGGERVTVSAELEPDLQQFLDAL